MIVRPLRAGYFYKIKRMSMKKIIFIAIITLGTSNLLNAQLLNKLKEKTKTATENSVNRSTDKVVDKTINQPADHSTDKALNKAGDKLNKLFKNKKKKNGDSTAAVVPASDSVAIKSKE